MKLTRHILALSALVLSSLCVAPAHAHEFDPHIVQIIERAPDDYTVRWTEPRETSATLAWPGACTQRLTREREPVRWFEVSCAPETRPLELSVSGLTSPQDHVLLELRSAPDRREQHLIRGTSQRVEVLDARPKGALEVARSYLLLGIEHLLFGLDHLFFVLGLFGLIRGRRRLVVAATAFSAGHALTLCLSALDVIALSPAPVEACIALSIVWLARELLSEDEAPRTSAPWVALGFGLLHGLGFAGALGELGLPREHMLIALGMFNVGIEIAQFAVIGACIVAAHMTREWAHRVHVVGGYAMGGVAMSWLFKRVAALVS